MTVPKRPTKAVLAARAEWVGLATAVEQVAKWSAAEGWAADRRTETVTERRLGTYAVPAVTVHPPGGEVSVTPVAFDLLGHAGGWVNIEAVPTLSWVKLVWGEDGKRNLIAGSNIPLRRPWTRRTFVQLVSDLLS